MSEAAVLTRQLTTSHTGGSVLIIDDEAAIRESLETLLELNPPGLKEAQAGPRVQKP